MSFHKGAYARRFAKAEDQKMGNLQASCGLGHGHRSKLEASVCQLLHLREKAGEIKDIESEVRVLICGEEGHECSSKQKIESIVDFRFKDALTYEIQFAEAKGFATDVYALKRRLWIHNRKERLEVWKGDFRKPYLAEVLEAK